MVNTHWLRARASASSQDTPSALASRASSRAAKIECPSFRCSVPGVSPIARSARSTADAEQEVLGQAEAPVAHVEPSGDPAVDASVVGVVAVEQIERDPSHVHPPHEGADPPILDGHLDA